MKKISLLSALTVSTMLSACGGGGGGGHGSIPNTTLPDIVVPENQIDTTNNDAVTGMQTRVITNEDGFTNLVRQNLGDDIYAGVQQPYNMRMLKAAPASNTNMCKSVNDCNKEVFDNMIKVLVDYDLENASLPEIKQALLLAGFTQQDLAGHIDDIKAAKNWIIEHKNEIKTKIDDIFSHYATLTIRDAKLNLVTLHEDKQNSYVRLNLDENDKITTVEVSKNNGMASALNYNAERDGITNDFVTGEKTIYRYGINTPYYTGTYIESFEELSSDEIKEKLNKRVDELAATGAYDNGNDSTEDIVTTIKKAIEIAFEITEENPSITKDGVFVTKYEGDAEEIDFEYDPENPQPLPFEYFHMNYNKNEKITYKSYMTSEENQNNEMKLAYSDFGILTKKANYSKEVLEGAKEETFVFAGGYDSKKIDPQNITTNMTFSGYAMGAVNVGYGENQGSETFRELAPLQLNGSAELELDATNGKQTLTAEFDNWYDVTATSNIDGSNSVLTLNNWNGASNDYKFRDQSEYTVNDFTTAKQLAADPNEAIEAGNQDHSDPAFGGFNIGYYGDANNPREATGYLYYEESRGYNQAGISKDDFINQNGPEKADDYYDSNKNISVNIGFGAVKQ
ncbi:MAG: hypothetical protein E7017_03550 [Alphaproteobacteria bacterium]|nr:hypothetical protein [Alphaproteobacteria bacterium]